MCRNVEFNVDRVIHRYKPIVPDIFSQNIGIIYARINGYLCVRSIVEFNDNLVRELQQGMRNQISMVIAEDVTRSVMRGRSKIKIQSSSKVYVEQIIDVFHSFGSEPLFTSSAILCSRGCDSDSCTTKSR